MKPFSGIRIVDFTQAHAGSLATMLLCDMGAEVIKIERAGSGDLARSWAPFREGKSGYYAYLNRGKKSVSLDLAKPEGRELVKKLIATADVVCENFKYGSMERMGLSYEAVRAVKPDIIYASLNGFGQNGPMRKTIGLDLQLQSMSGVMDATGFPDGDPVRVGVAFGDHLSGTYMALGVSLALMERRRTGRGQYIDIAILDSLFSLLGETMARPAGEPIRLGNASAEYAPCDCFPVRDGYIILQVVEDGQWQALCEALDIRELAERADCRTNLGRVERYGAVVKPALAAALAGRGKKELEEQLQKRGVPCAAVRTVDEATDALRSDGLLAHIQDKGLGSVRFPDSHFHIDSIDTRVTGSAPLRGEHTEYYLDQLGLSRTEIEGLCAKGAAERWEE